MFARLAVTNAAALLMAISSCLAGGIVLPSTLTVGGQKFEGVTYSSHNDAKLTIQHESGIARLQISELPKDLQAQLGYDPDKAAAELKREVDANLAAAAQAADEERARINAAERAKMKEQARDMAFDVSEHLSEGIFVIVCKPLRRSTAESDRFARVGLADARVWYEWVPGHQDALLVGYTKSVAVGERVEAKAFDAGVRDVEVGGQMRKLRVYEIAD